MRKLILCFSVFFSLSLVSLGQSHGQSDEEEQQTHHASEAGDDHHQEVTCANVDEHHDHAFDPGQTAFHHISDQNIYSIGPIHFPLPCFLYAPGHGWDVFSSGVFEADSHGNGAFAYNRYVLDEGSVRRIVSDDFPMGKQAIKGIIHKMEPDEKGKERETAYVCFNGQPYRALAKSTADGGLFGGGITNFYDFSLTKNVVTMILIAFLLGWMFIGLARRYRERDGEAPKGLQGFIEPMFVFIQDEVAKPFLGHKWEKYLPFLMALFFFILALNLFGQIPFLGGSNVTGNLAVTMVLAIFAFFVTNLNGNKHYWEHVFWMPGVPAWVKTILTPVEFLGLFIKPLTLMLRLFANITAGHMVVLIFVSLIFIFGNSGANPGGAWGAAVGSTLLTMFMMAIELLVAFIQAFVFTILTASYIGAATEEQHH